MAPRILVAGIGNVFLGDDGFGVETVHRLAAHALPDGVKVVDFGVRGMDMVYALLDPYDAIICVDAATRGAAPGTLYLIEPEIATDGMVSLDTHGMDPVKVLALARALGARPTRTYVVACEPGFLPDPESEDVVMELSAPVQGALDEAVRMIESLIAEIGNNQDKVEPCL